jgi:hypothetical protein
MVYYVENALLYSEEPTSKPTSPDENIKKKSELMKCNTL